MSLSFHHYQTLLTTYLRPQRRMVAVLAVLLFSGIGLELLNPQILRSFIDTAQQQGDLAVLVRGALLFIGVALANQVVSVATTYASERVGWTATNQLHGDLLLHCLRLDLAFHKTHTPGEMIERIDGDVTAMAKFFSQFVLQVLGSLLLLIGALVLLWREDWRVGLALTIFTFIAMTVLARIRNIGVAYETAESEASATLFGFLEERLGGIEDLRANGASAFVLRRFGQHQRDLALKERTAGMMGARMWVITAMLFAVGYTLALALGVYLFRRGAITIGTVFLFYQYTELLRIPLERLTRQFQDLQEASAGLLRVLQLLQTTATITDGQGGSLPDGALPVVFERVAFAYETHDASMDDGQPSTVSPTTDHRPPTTDLVLHDLSFQLQPGTKLGLLGRTGSGKTTITRLLLRLYDPVAGQVRLGDQDVRAARLAELREGVGIVTQDVQLFQGSLRDNLTMFDPNIPDSRIHDVIDSLGLQSWYATLPAGLDTPIQPGGLSAGEAQLQAFARVFLQDPGLVILDEASSRLDPATEQLIERAVERLLAGRTGIIIAHRLRTVQRADEIMILESGRIAEYGKREQLQRDPDSRFAHLLRTGIEEVLA